jgi:cell division protein FtsB
MSHAAGAAGAAAQAPLSLGERVFDAQFRGVPYSVAVDVRDDAVRVRVTCLASASGSLLGGSNGAPAGVAWSSVFSAARIEDICAKTAVPKKFAVFVRMLLTALDSSNSGSNVVCDLLSYQDLPNVTSDGLQRTDKRYLIVTYSDGFDRVHFPLPLVEEPSSVSGNTSTRNTSALSGTAGGAPGAAGGSTNGSPTGAAATGASAQSSAAAADAGAAEQVRHLQLENDRLTREYTHRTDVMRRELQRAQQDAEDAKHKLASFRKQSVREIRALQQDCETLGRDLGALQAENAQLKAQAAGANASGPDSQHNSEAECRMLRKDVKRLEAQLAKEQAASARAIGKLQDEKQELKEQIAAMRTEEARLKTQIKILQRDLLSSQSGSTGSARSGTRPTSASRAVRGRSSSPRPVSASANQPARAAGAGADGAAVSGSSRPSSVSSRTRSISPALSRHASPYDGALARMRQGSGSSLTGAASGAPRRPASAHSLSSAGSGHRAPSPITGESPSGTAGSRARNTGTASDSSAGRRDVGGTPGRSHVRARMHTRLTGPARVCVRAAGRSGAPARPISAYPTASGGAASGGYASAGSRSDASSGGRAGAPRAARGLSPGDAEVIARSPYQNRPQTATSPSKRAGSSGARRPASASASSPQPRSSSRGSAASGGAAAIRQQRSRDAIVASSTDSADTIRASGGSYTAMAGAYASSDMEGVSERLNRLQEFLRGKTSSLPSRR